MYPSVVFVKFFNSPGCSKQFVCTGKGENRLFFTTFRLADIIYSLVNFFKLALDLLTIDLDINFVLSSHDSRETAVARLAHPAKLRLLARFLNFFFFSFRFQRAIRAPAKQLLS